MTDITANVIVSMPSQLFTMARSFKAVTNGKIYIGKIDTDPVNPENQIQVYVENEDGSHVPVPQPIIINAAGYPVYNGQIAKFVTVQGHSMAVYDAYGAQQFYFPNVLKYDPDQFRIYFDRVMHDMAKPITYFGAVPGEDCSEALESALHTGLPFFFPDGEWVVTRDISYTGKVNFWGTPGATLKSNSLLKITDGSGSRVGPLNIMPIGTPYTIKRNSSTWVNTASDVVQSYEGYIPNVQDTDIWASIPQSYKDYNTRFKFALVFDVSNANGGNDVVVSSITGRCVSIVIQGYTDSTVRDCDFGSGQKTFGGVVFVNGVDRNFDLSHLGYNLPRGKNNSIINNKIKYATLCGAVWFGNDEYSMIGNESTFNGESGLKTYQYDGVPGLSESQNVFSTRGRVIGNKVSDNFYDGIDLALFNLSSVIYVYGGTVVQGNNSQRNRHTGYVTNASNMTYNGNHANENGTHGMSIVGDYNTVVGNSARNNGTTNLSILGQVFDIVVQGKNCVSCNNNISNPNAPSQYNYLHSGFLGVDPDGGQEGYDFGNYCDHGTSRMYISKNIPSYTYPAMFGLGSRENTGDAQLIVRQSGGGVDLSGRSNEGSVRLRGDASSGANVDFQPISEDPSTTSPTGRIRYDFPTKKMLFATEKAVKMELGDTAGLYPTADNSIGLGLPSNRWTAVYAASGSIITSDGNLKCDERGLSEAELATAKSLKSIIKAYRFIDAVNAKGEDARIHFGVIAQEVIEAFNANGLDAFKYGIVCYDEWEEQKEIYDSEGNLLTPLVPDGCRYGIRYDELVVFILSAI
ncbi:TPA: hypothetical protein JZG76_000772 [Escherichia coli]|nr:hypothetical protein [Escherichia coli]